MTKREQYGRVASRLQTLVHVIVSGRFANPLAFVEYPFLESDRSTGAHEVSLKALRQKYRGTNTGFFVSMSEDANRVVVPTQAQLTFIQVVFKLSNSQLARILDVK